MRFQNAKYYFNHFLEIILTPFQIEFLENRSENIITYLLTILIFILQSHD